MKQKVEKSGVAFTQDNQLVSFAAVFGCHAMLPQKKVFSVGALCDIQKTIVKETNVEAEINRIPQAESRLRMLQFCPLVFQIEA